MANKANRFKLRALRKLLASIGQAFEHLFPWPQFRREKTPFEQAVVDGIAAAKQLNAERPRYHRQTVKSKKVRRMLSREVRRVAALPGVDREAYIARVYGGKAAA